METIDFIEILPEEKYIRKIEKMKQQWIGTKIYNELMIKYDTYPDSLYHFLKIYQKPTKISVSSVIKLLKSIDIIIAAKKKSNY